MNEIESMRLIKIEKELKDVKEFVQYNNGLIQGLMFLNGMTQEDVNKLVKAIAKTIERCENE